MSILWFDLRTVHRFRPTVSLSSKGHLRAIFFFLGSTSCIRLRVHLEVEMLLRNLNHVVEVLANAKSIVALVESAIRSVQTGIASLFHGGFNHSPMWTPTLAPVHAMGPFPGGFTSGDGTKHEPGSFLGMPRERCCFEYADPVRMNFPRNLSAHARQSANKRAMRRG